MEVLLPSPQNHWLALPVQKESTPLQKVLKIPAAAIPAVLGNTARWQVPAANTQGATSAKSNSIKTNPVRPRANIVGKVPATKVPATRVVSAHPRALLSTRPTAPRTAPKDSTAKVGRLDESRATKEHTPPTSVPSNVSPVLLVRLPPPRKPLNAKSVQRDGFRKKKAKTNAIHRTMAPFRRVALLR